MRQENLPPDERIKLYEAIQGMGAKLVQLGLAQSTVAFDQGGVLRIRWTERGRVLRDEMRRIFKVMENGEIFDFYELQALVSILKEAHDKTSD